MINVVWVGARGKRPLAPMLGWYILVRKRTLGGAMGYSSGRNNSSLKTPSVRGSGATKLLRGGQDVLWNGLPSGPWIVTSKYLRLSSCGAADIPGAGSATRRS